MQKFEYQPTKHELYLSSRIKTLMWNSWYIPT